MDKSENTEPNINPNPSSSATPKQETAAIAGLRNILPNQPTSRETANQIAPDPQKTPADTTSPDQAATNSSSASTPGDLLDPSTGVEATVSPNSVHSQISKTTNFMPPEHNDYMMPGVESSLRPLTSDEHPSAPSLTNTSSSTFDTSEFATPKSSLTIHKRESKIIKFLRVLIWGAVAFAIPIGYSLRKLAQSSVSYTNGTNIALAEWSNTILYIAVSVGALNLLWGIARWFLRWRRERWTLPQVIPKLIGGGIWRCVVFTILICGSLLLISPLINRTLTTQALKVREQTLSESFIAQPIPGINDFDLPAFTQNYTRLVPNGAQVITDATQSENPLTYLYDTAGAEIFRQVWNETAELNLNQATNLHAGYLPTGAEIPCTEFCETSYTAAPISLHYLYFDTTEYLDTKLTIIAPSQETTISLYGQDHTGKWQRIDRVASELVFEITPEVQSRYPVITLVVTNSSIAESSNFLLRIVANQLSEIAESRPIDPIDTSFSMLSDNCIDIHFDNIFGLPEKFYQAISKLDTSKDFSEIIQTFEQEFSTNEAKATQHAMVCNIPLQAGVAFEQAKDTAKSLLDWSLPVLNIETATHKFSALAHYDILTHFSQLYLIMSNANSTSLIHIHMLDKVSDNTPNAVNDKTPALDAIDVTDPDGNEDAGSNDGEIELPE